MEEWPQVLHESSCTIHAFCITVLLGKVLQSDAGRRHNTPWQETKDFITHGTGMENEVRETRQFLKKENYG